MGDRLETKKQASAYTSPWSLSHRLATGLWHIVYILFFRPTPKVFNPWRLFLLRLFGCRISGRPFVSGSASIKYPWKLVLGHRSCLGAECDIYNLGGVILKPYSTVAQQAYLCGGTHDLSRHDLPLQTGRIVIGRNAFIGARAFIMPGVHVGDDAVVGAGSVVTKDVPTKMICAGNPCRVLCERQYVDDAPAGNV